MASEWFFKIAGEVVGPLSARQLRAMARQGKLAPSDKIRRGTEGAWLPAQRVKGLFPETASADPDSAATDLPTARLVDPVTEANPAAEPAASRAVKPLGMPLARAAAEPPQRPTAAPLSDSDRALPAAARPAPRRTSAIGQSPIHVGGAMAASGGVSTGRRRKKRNNTALIASLVVLIAGLGVLAAVLPRIRSQSTPTATNRAAEPAAAMSPPQKQSAEIKWVDAASPVESGDARIQIESALIGIAPLKRDSDEPVRRKVECLMIGVRIENLSPLASIEYTSWNPYGAGRPSIELSDDSDDVCRPIRFQNAKVDGQLDTAKIGPKESVRDLLVFEKPADDARYLRLELSAAAVSQEGTLYLQIPREMVQSEQPERLAGEPAQQHEPPADSGRPARAANAGDPGATRFDPSYDPNGDVSQIAKDIEELKKDSDIDPDPEELFPSDDGFVPPPSTHENDQKNRQRKEEGRDK